MVPIPIRGLPLWVSLRHLVAPLEFAMVRNPYVGRTFIRPGRKRELAVKIKLDLLRLIRVKDNYY